MENSNRTVLTTSVAKTPKIFTPEDRGFSQCCEPFQVLFDENDTSSYKNDVNSAWSLGDTVTFILKKDGVVTTYVPTSIAFPNEPNAYYCTIIWRDVFLTDGIGCYELYVSVDYAGLSAEKLWGKYDVQPYFIAPNYYTGRGTVRMYSIFNDVNTFEGINFTGAYVRDTLRFKAKFGYWNDLTEVDNVQFTDGEKTKVRREDLTEYELRVDLHGQCIIDKLRFHLVAENACFISDHNPDNYSYEYLDFPVIVKEGFTPNWIDGTRRVKGVAKFENKSRMTKTHFQDNDSPGNFELPSDVWSVICADATVENFDASYQAWVVSGGTLVVPNSDVNVNGSNEGDVISVKTIDINITDGTDPVTPDSIAIVGNTVTIAVPSGSDAPVGATLMKTGQTTSYRTGDDGDLEAGRATSFLVLASNNPFGNTNRFTDELGGTTYTNNIVIDWSTYDGSTVLGYYRLIDYLGNVTWDVAIDTILAATLGTFTGWRLTNYRELINMLNFGQSPRPYDYSPFLIGAAGSASLWISTTRVDATTNAYLLGSVGNVGVAAKSGASGRGIACRTFTVTGTTLT